MTPTRRRRGGASSNVIDLAKWMAMRLANGAAPDGAKLIDPTALLEIVTPRSVASPRTAARAVPGSTGSAPT